MMWHVTVTKILCGHEKRGKAKLSLKMINTHVCGPVHLEGHITLKTGKRKICPVHLHSDNDYAQHLQKFAAINQKLWEQLAL